MMTDDVPNSITTYANRYSEEIRRIPEVEELTGSRSQEQITRALNNLEIK